MSKAAGKGRSDRVGRHRQEFHHDDKDDDRDDRGGDRHDRERPGDSDSDDGSPARAPKSNTKRDESEDDRVLSFVPSDGIEIEVLDYYLRRYLDHSSEALPGRHPRDEKLLGFLVRSRRGLSSLMIRDLREDSTLWVAERAQNAKRRETLEYKESRTAKRRRDHGPSGEPTARKSGGRAVSIKPESITTTTGVPVSSAAEQDQRRLMPDPRHALNVPIYPMVPNRHQPYSSSMYSESRYEYTLSSAQNPGYSSIAAQPRTSLMPDDLPPNLRNEPAAHMQPDYPIRNPGVQTVSRYATAR